MKKKSIFLFTILLIASIFSACKTSAKVETAPTELTVATETEASTAAPTEETSEAISEATEEDIVYEGDAAPGTPPPFLNIGTKASTTKMN